MKQAIVIFTEKNKDIDRIRKKYDPYYKKFKSHITLAFPFENISQKELYNHIKKSLHSIRSFKMTLQGIRKSPEEYYLYLLVKKGKKEILKIHKRLYLRLLTKYLRKDIPYIPHMTLGVFKKKKEIDRALKELKNKNLEIKAVINSIYLINLNKNLSLKSYKKFYLS